MIRVGGATEIEVKERKDRVDDALHATRAAVEEGILPGGGVALLRAQKALKGIKTTSSDQKAGIDIVRRALKAPARQIVENAGEGIDTVISAYNYALSANLENNLRVRSALEAVAHRKNAPAPAAMTNASHHVLNERLRRISFQIAMFAIDNGLLQALIGNGLARP